MAVGAHGWLIFLCFDEEKKTSKIFKAKLHNPVSEITLVAEDVSGHHISYANGLVFCGGRGSELSFHSTEKRYDPKTKVEKLRTKKVLQDVMDEITLPSHGSIKECKDRLAKYQKQVRSTYEDNKWDENKVIFRNEPEQPKTDALVVVDERLMYAASPSKGQVIKIATQRNSIGLQADATAVKVYADNWNHV